MEKKRDLENQIQHRSQPVEFDIKEDRTIEFSFSSEKPVYRGQILGNEILDHREGAIDFSRLNDAAPLLFNHDVNKPIGVVEKAWTKDKRGYARVRFSDNPFPSEVYNDVKSGILRGVSVGYSVNETREEKDKEDFYRVTSWTPAEISIAVVAADESIGIGRAKENVLNTSKQQESSNMTTEQRESAVASPDAPHSKPSEKTEMTDTPDLTVVRDEASKKAASDERNRIREISVLCERHQLGNELKETLISDGTSIGETRKIALEKLQAKPVETVEQIDSTETNDIGYRGIEDSMSYLLYGKDHSRGAGAASEVSEEVLKRGGVQRTSERSVFIPYGALAPKNLRATYNTGASGTGGALVGVDYLPERFLETLQATSSVMAMGVTVLPGLVGDVSIPKRDTDATAYWLSTEVTAITQSESTFSNVSLTPKRVAAYSKWSMQTEQQALPAIEELSRRNLITKIDQARDLAILNGSGSSGQPTGILNTTGIGNIALGTNGGSVSLNNLIDLEGALSEDNALTGSLGYIAHSKIINQLKKARAGGSTTTDGAYLWNSNLQDISRGSTPGSINGYSIRENNLLPTNLTKGTASTCTPIIFGNFSDIYCGLWGAGIEVSISETEDDFIKLLTSIRAVTTMDVAVAHAQSFAAIKDALS
tara:strand:+ start:1430 stop:3388 length:1959 start_codon:yes stop_codon:yes gene_type:complete